MEDLISIIIPVYNAELYISKCLESILKQTYNNIELICVDDSSNDESLAILKAYADKDERIKVFLKKNEGVSKARNYGLKKANGKYVMFVDADDWIEKDTCQYAYEEMINANVDVVIWAYVSEFDDHAIPKVLFEEKAYFTAVDVKTKIHRRFVGIVGEELMTPEKADALCPVWGKLYKKDIIDNNHIQFIDLKEIGTYEDGMFNLYVFQHVRSATYLPQALYHYRRTNSESQTSKYRERLPKQWNTLFDLLSRYIIENKLGVEYENALNNRIALSILGLGLNILSSEYSINRKIKMINEIIEAPKYKKASAQLEMKYFSFPWKVFYGFAAHGFSIGIFILLTIIRKMIYG